MAKNLKIVEGAPLPPTTEALLARRNILTLPNLNDFVERVIVALWENMEFQGYLKAVSNPGAVTGKKIFDDLRAVDMIIAKAQDMGDEMKKAITEVKPAAVHISMRTVLRRYNLSREERYDEVKDGNVPSSEPTTENVVE